MTSVATTHLRPAEMALAQRQLVTKALAELSHERVLAPEHAGGGWYTVTANTGSLRYRFRARVLPLEHWDVDAESVQRLVGDRPTSLDVRRLVLDLSEALQIGDDVLPVYLEELASTLNGRAFKLAGRPPTSRALLEASFQELESAMTQGHPGFLANNGRLGFGADDYAAYAPETGATVRLVWLAVRAERAVVSTSADVDMDRLLAAELDEVTRERFDAALRAHDLDPAAYVLMPSHPWQWENKLAVTFAPEVANRELVYLGHGPDAYQPQQSLRTFFNLSRPGRYYVKTALSVLNMGFMRGLSAAYMEATPAINDWVDALVRSDPTLRDLEFGVLREVAAVGHRHAVFERAGRSPYTKMLSALWRESPQARVGEDERPATMASLLHVDAHERPLVAEMVEASGLDAAEWLDTYLRAYLVPLLHCFYAHRLVFMPHGENVILVLRGHVPVRVLLKDIGEEVVLLDGEAPLPPPVQRIRADVPDELQLLSLQTDVFDGFLRHLAALLDRSGLLDAEAFWRRVAGCVRRYQAAHPELRDRFEAHDLFAPTFPHSCLNRLQLRNNREMVDLDDPASALVLAGSLDNPLAAGADVAVRA
jgi:siderophore synthetase component